MTPDSIITEARRWLGTPYQHQASCLGAGADCLGLVRGIYRALYGQEPQTPPPYAAYAGAGEAETLLMAARHYLQAQPLPAPPLLPHTGHVLAFRMRRSLPVRHLAIMSFDGKMVHAVSGVHVCEVAFSAWWQRRCAAVFSFPNIHEANR